MNHSPAAISPQCDTTSPTTDDDGDIWGGEVAGQPAPDSEPAADASDDGLFSEADVVHSYSRAQAIADGVLVDISQGELGELVREAGFTFPIACTASVYGECIALTDAAKRAGNDIKGRGWDVLWMLRNAIQRSGNASVIHFELFVVRDRIRATRTKLKAVCGPGDDMEPVITIMFPEED